MPRESINLVQGDRIENGDYRDALPVNMYTVMRKIRGSDGYIINQPGITSFAATTGVDRGGFYSDQFKRHFRVTGNDLISIDETGNVTVLGTITGSLQVQMAQSFNNFAVVADGKLWYYNISAGFRRITDPNLGNPIDITFIDGYFFFTDGKTLYHTTLLSEEVINATDFDTSQFSPDPTVAVKQTEQDQVIAFNRYTTEYFTNTGGANFAFSRIKGASIKAGAVATQCVVDLEGTWFMLGSRRESSNAIYAVSGGGVSQVSTREVDKIIATYTENDLQNASLEARTDDGYSFMHVNLPNHTLLYNHTVAKSVGVGYAWTILKTSATVQDGWLGINGVRVPNVGWVYGDRFDARLGKLDKSVSTLYGRELEFLFYSPFLPIEDASIDSIEINTIPGFTDKKATVSFSTTYDGQAYGFEFYNLYSEINGKNQRFIARRFGYVRDFVGFKFRAITSSQLAFGALEVTYG